jgi:hypothetical protein
MARVSKSGGMTDPADSIVSSTRSSPLRTVAAALALVGIAGVGFWLFTRGKGADEDPARVLIIGPTPELTDFLERKGFDVSRLSLGEAIGQGQSFDASLDDLPAMLEYADQSGFGYLALNMAHGERYDFSTIGYDAEEPPPGTTFAVVSVGDLGTHVSYGGVTPEVMHVAPVGEQLGLLFALFEQPEISTARGGNGNNDLLIRFGAADTVEDVLDYEKGQASMQRQVEAWHALAERERATDKPIELARPYELLRGWPLANGSLLLAAGRDAWRTTDGISSTWVGEELVATLSVVALDAPEQRLPCASLPDTLAMPSMDGSAGGFAVAPAGDALLIPTDAYVADLYVLTGADCSFEKRDPIRRLDGGELGNPRASGRTASSAGGRLMWADAKLRSYHSVGLDGVELTPYELHWLADDLVVVPAKLDFAVAAQARLDRMALAADPSGATMTEEIDPATQPLPSEALLFIRLPPPNVADELRLAVIPIGALLSDGPHPTTTSIRTVHSLAAKPGSVAVVIDTTAGPVLMQATIDSSQGQDSWPDALAIDYDLAAASALGKASIALEQLAGLPKHLVHLAIAPDASLVTWGQPFGGGGEPDWPDHEIMLLPLGVEGATPTRLTDNARSDVHPRFVAGSHLVFDSSYTAADELPTVEAVRALAIPPTR